MKNLSSAFPACCLALLAGCRAPESTPVDSLRFAAFADVQYCSTHEEMIGRHYMLAREQLADAIRRMNVEQPEFVLNLGDLIDHNWENYPLILSEFDKLRSPVFSVAGNHDFSVPDNKKFRVFAKLGMPAPYYMFRRGPWRFLALNTSDISLHAWPKDSDGARRSREIIDNLYPEEKQRGFNGGYSDEQLRWVDAQLAEAHEAGEQVVIFQHCPVIPGGATGDTTIVTLNSDALLELIDRYPGTVRLCLSGHHHAGGEFVRGNVLYKTVKGQVEAAAPTWILVEIDDEKVSILGFGDENDSVLTLKAND